MLHITRVKKLPILNELILLAEYNKLMNHRQYDAVATLAPDDLKKDVGAYFKSVLGTLNHIIVGDIIWLTRFSKHPSSNNALSYFSTFENPKSLNTLVYKDLDLLYEERKNIDRLIMQWLGGLNDVDLNSCLQYKNMAGKDFNKPLVSLINHLFLHQVHHRGQISTLLSQFGVDFGETDIIEIIDECSA
jgi:uncharacterized damage-inducible protein DinB